MKWFVVSLFALVLAPLASFAACSSPSGDEGDVIYSSTAKMLQFCNGTVWVNAAGVAPSSGGSSSGGGGSTLYLSGTRIGPIIDSSSANNGNPGSLTVYVDGASAIAGASLASSGPFSTSAYAYFSEPDCSGNLVGSSATSAFSYGCSGAETCTTGVFYGADYRQYNIAVKSRRNSSGNCSAYDSTINPYPVYYIYCQIANNAHCEVR